MTCIKNLKWRNKTSFITYLNSIIYQNQKHHNYVKRFKQLQVKTGKKITKTFQSFLDNFDDPVNLLHPNDGQPLYVGLGGRPLWYAPWQNHVLVRCPRFSVQIKIGLNKLNRCWIRVKHICKWLVKFCYNYKHFWKTIK